MSKDGPDWSVFSLCECLEIFEIWNKSMVSAIYLRIFITSFS